MSTLKQLVFFPIFTARKRSLRRLCFYRCLSGHNGGGHAWLLPGGACMVALGGGMRGCSRGAGVVPPAGHVWLLPGGVWLLPGGAWLLWRVRGCSGGHAWFFWGACMVAPGGVWFFPGGGMHGFSWGGMHRIRRDTVNERAVRILLECILVNLKIRLTRLGLSFQK